MGAALKMQEDPEVNSSGSSWSKIIIRDYWDWSYLGLCKDPRLSKMFGLKGKVQSAKAWCQICPVKDDCLLWAVIYKESGVWGGTTDSERKEMFSKKDREELIIQAKLQGNYYQQETPGSLIRQVRKRQEEQSEE